MGDYFSISRWLGIVGKELIQLKRDRLTFGMIVGIPIIQLVLFGFAINADPKHLPTAALIADRSEFSRSIMAGLKNSDYFAFIGEARDEADADRMLRTGEAQFVVTIPSDFSKRLVRGERPAILLEADATDPTATGNAISAVNQLAATVLARDLNGALASLSPLSAANAPQGALMPTVNPFEIRVHARYNPEQVTAYNIVPGLLGVILTMTMVMMTGLAITRERERGTMENLLATPATALEVMTGKIMPYIGIGLIQVTLVVTLAQLLFSVPMQGSYTVLYVSVLLFIAANLMLGLTISAVAENQLQAMQMTFFYFLPSILLSGFMFPFRGMPDWAQYVGQLLPITHFLRIVRGVLLKGNGWSEIGQEAWPMAAFMLVILLIGLRAFRSTLD
ncbi:MAG TPA: ABC transporter permease [Casimicrobiaceae bacterium]|nr:ABC transporter permease [Casimicrobiaceae bacterium]